MNRIFLIGRLGRDPELTRPASGATAFCRLAVATDRRRKDGDTWVDETDWHSVTTFGREAENCAQYLTKGALVAVEGSLHLDKWVDAQGQKRVSPKVVGDRITFLSPTRPEASESEALQATA